VQGQQKRRGIADVREDRLRGALRDGGPVPKLGEPMKKTIPVIVVGVLLYAVLFAPELDSELTVSRGWAFDPEAADRSADAEGTAIPFRTATRLGYTTVDGSVTYEELVLSDVALGQSGFVNYTSLGSDMVVQRPDGSVESPLDTRGYPLILDDRLFVFATNRSRIEEWSFAGALIWSRDYGALVTAFDARGSYAIAGLLDGTVQVYDARGDIDYDDRLDDARISVVYGCTVADDGSTFVAVHGLDPQVLSVYRRSDSRYALVGTVELDEQYRRNRMVFLSPDGNTVLIEGIDRVWVYRIARELLSSFPLSGSITDVQTFEDVLWITSLAEDRTAHVALASHQGIPYSQDQFDSGQVTTRRFGRSVVIGSDQTVGGIELVSR